MCGIAVFIGNDRNEGEAFVKRANHLMEHRGPDGQGVYTDSLISLGHRRLAILDLSEAGHQPMQSGNNRYWMVYNGEIYNHLELRKKYLPAHTFKGHSDSETILELYSVMGSAMLDELVGMWAMAIWDTQEKKVFISRDRYGQKPLYWRLFENGNLCFSSEIRPLLKDGQRNEYNPLAIVDYLSTGNYGHLGTQTFFKNIHQFPQGHWALFSSEQKHFVPKNYWKYPNHPEKEKEPFDKQNASRINESIRRAVSSQLISDVQVGATLSGGIDSSITVGAIASIAVNKLNVFTAQTSGSKWDESKYVKAVEAKWGKNKIHLIWKELKETSLSKSLPRNIEIQEEPFGDPSIVAHGELMDAARENNTPVILGGQGADEIFWGYHFMISGLMAGMIKKGQWSKALGNMKVLGYSSTAVSKTVFSALFPSLEKAARKRSRLQRRNWLSDKLCASVMDVKANLYDYSNLYSITESAVYGICIPHLVHYDDRSAMARSIEGRMPFLDHRIAEIVSRIRYSDLIEDGQSKFLLRQSCLDLLPGEVLDRRDKIGFYTPLVSMLRNDFTWIKTILEEEQDSVMEIVNHNAFTEKVSLFEKGDNNTSLALDIFRVLSVVLWMRTFNIQTS